MVRAGVGLVVLMFAAATAGWASGGVQRASGTLNLRGTVPFFSDWTLCPEGTPEAVVCHNRTGTEFIPGLGRVTETYLFRADPRPCPPESWTILSYDARLNVEGKGDLVLAVAATPFCTERLKVPSASPQSFTVAQGTGIYAGATGSGTLTRVAGLPGAHVPGMDTWTGTVVASAVDFDLTPPTITGTRSRTVRVPRRAKNARVTYRVNATDAVDGPASVTCRPPSGSKFKIGRTKVMCSATDGSGNTATASFTVTVTRRR